MKWNVKWHEMSNDTKCHMTQNVKWHKMGNDTKWQSHIALWVKPHWKGEIKNFAKWVPRPPFSVVNFEIFGWNSLVSFTPLHVLCELLFKYLKNMIKPKINHKLFRVWHHLKKVWMFLDHNWMCNKLLNLKTLISPFQWGLTHSALRLSQPKTGGREERVCFLD